MIIQIEYDGSVAKCSLSGCIPTASCPNVDQFKTYSFNEADKMSQIKAIEAFRTIENSWMRENNVKSLKSGPKVDTDKFIALLVELFCDRQGIDRRYASTYIDEVLEKMGFKIKDGEIIELNKK
jgi:hypothetical protein